MMAIGCSPNAASDATPDSQKPGPASHAVRARKLKKIMAELDYLRSQRLPQELDAESDRAARVDDIRAAAEALASAAEDIPSVLTEVKLPHADEDLFYELAERLGAAALELRDQASSDDPAAIDRAFEGVASTCNACHSRFRVMPAANTQSED
jgi:cytochrome c556